MSTVSDHLPIQLRINGNRFEGVVSTRCLLSDFLRHDLGLTGTHVGCEHGVCGACTILIDGRAARSCLQLAVQCDGSDIVTIEGISPSGGGLTSVQQAFTDEHGLQCGFCTPGFIMAITAFIAEQQGRSEFTDAEIREAISGNLCRCTGYQGIVAATRSALNQAAGPDV